MQGRKQAILAIAAVAALLFLTLLASLALPPALVLGVNGGARQQRVHLDGG